MIMFVEGTLAYRFEGAAVINVGGVGYVVHVSPNIEMCNIGESLRIYTHMSVKEDSVSLFGFTTQDELEIFGVLIGVSGVGPKAAQSLIGIMQPRDIALAIISEDTNSISKAPGIGKKIAARICLELRERVSRFLDGSAQMSIQEETQEDPRTEALQALQALGYPRTEALKAMTQTTTPAMGTQDIIRAALRKLNK